MVFLYTVLVLAVSTSNIILKGDLFRAEKESGGGRGGALYSLGVCRQGGSTKEKREHDKKIEGGEDGCGRR